MVLVCMIGCGPGGEGGNIENLGGWRGEKMSDVWFRELGRKLLNIKDDKYTPSIRRLGMAVRTQ